MGSKTKLSLEINGEDLSLKYRKAKKLDVPGACSEIYSAIRRKDGKHVIIKKPVTKGGMSSRVILALAINEEKKLRELRFMDGIINLEETLFEKVTINKNEENLPWVILEKFPFSLYDTDCI